MFKKDIWYKLTILITCFAVIIGLCTWKSNTDKKAYDVNRYNLLNEVKLTESSDELLNINQSMYEQYRLNSDYYSIEEIRNSAKRKTFLNESVILKTNLNDILSIFEMLKTNKVDYSKGFAVPLKNRVNYLFFSGKLINNILEYKAQLERFKKLEDNSFVNFKQLNDILKTDFCDLNGFLLGLEEKDSKSSSNKHYMKVRKILMRFYGILFKLYGENNIKKLVSNFTQGSFESKNSKGEVAGVTVFSNNLFKQYIKLKNSVFCTQMCKNSYIGGFWSSYNCAYAFIHEMGHAIDNFFGLSQHQRDKLNTAQYSYALPLFKNIVLDPLYTYCSSVAIGHERFKNSKAVQNHIYQSIFEPQQFNTNNSEKNNNSDFKKEAMFVFAPSKYARQIDQQNPEGWQEEFFAECFAYWMLTPDKYRDIRWAILNDYFINKFGQ